MTAANAAERLLAYRAGQPLPSMGAWALPRAPRAQRLVLVFVRMAGETGMWGFAAGRTGKPPRIVTVPEPRNQDAAASLACQLWEVLAPELPHPSCFPASGHDQDAWATAAAEASLTWQLCLPGPSHLEMLHHLNYRWARAKKADPAQIAALNALGRACGFLFRESSRPGQVRVIDLTACLREAWAFPSDGIRQAHLGYLLGLLEPQSSLAARVASAEHQEGCAVGATLDPEVDRDTLEPLLAGWHREPAGSARKAILGQQIHAVLEEELRRRFDLACRALAVIDADPRPENARLVDLLKASVYPFQHEYFLPESWHLEAARRAAKPPFVPSPETDDHAGAAARRFFAHQRDQDASASALVHGDPVLAERLIQSGGGVRGKIARAGKVVGRRYPTWTVDVPGQGALSLRVGSRVGVLGLPQRGGQVLEVTPTATGRRMVVEISKGHPPRPADGLLGADAPALQGREVVLVGEGAAGISMRKLKRLKEIDSAATWLHGTGTRPKAEVSATPAAALLKMVGNLEKGRKP